MKTCVWLILLLAVPGPAASSIEGQWLTDEGKARIRIEPCGDNLCGVVVWLGQPNGADGLPRRDVDSLVVRLSCR